VPIELQPAASPVRAASEPRAWSEITIGSQAVTGKDRIFFTERLALLIETGNPLHVSLDVLERQADRPQMRAVIADLRDGVSGGLSLSQALSQHAEAFPPSYVSVVAAGEHGGFLPEVLERRRELDEKRDELRSTLFSAFSYPAFLVVFSFAVVLFVLMVVFPKFGDLFQQIWEHLPVTTRFLMTLSEFLRHYWVAFLAAIAAAGVGVWRWAAHPRGREALDDLVLRLPVLGELVVLYQLVQFMHVMSLALSNGVPVLDALGTCREIVASPRFRRFVEGLEVRVSEGRGIASGFREAEFVPPLVQQMIATAEETGSLALVMGRMASFYEREWKTRLTTLAKLVEPAMLVVMGVVVGLIVSSLILPIFKLSTTVH
jgi:type II secretory pathway component PulF